MDKTLRLGSIRPFGNIIFGRRMEIKTQEKSFGKYHYFNFGAIYIMLALFIFSNLCYLIYWRLLSYSLKNILLDNMVIPYSRIAFNRGHVLNEHRKAKNGFNFNCITNNKPNDSDECRDLWYSIP